MISEWQDHRPFTLSTHYGLLLVSQEPLLLGLSYLSQAPRKGKSLQPRYLYIVSGDFSLMFQGWSGGEVDLEVSPCYQSLDTTWHPGEWLEKGHKLALDGPPRV